MRYAYRHKYHYSFFFFLEGVTETLATQILNEVFVEVINN